MAQTALDIDLHRQQTSIHVSEPKTDWKKQQQTGGSTFTRARGSKFIQHNPIHLADSKPTVTDRISLPDHRAAEKVKRVRNVRQQAAFVWGSMIKVGTRRRRERGELCKKKKIQMMVGLLRWTILLVLIVRSHEQWVSSHCCSSSQSHSSGWVG